MSNQVLSPESTREARKFFLSPQGQEFLQYMADKRPVIAPSPEVHNFSFSAGRPAGYDLYASNIDAVINPEETERAPRRDTIHS
jgi:hypothetical protein